MNGRIFKTLVLLVATCMFVSAARADVEGTITARLNPAPGLLITSAQAILFEQTSLGIKPRSVAAQIKDSILTVPGLRFPSGTAIILRFETPDGSIEGWDATVPKSDYEVEQPLSTESIQTLARKTAPEANTAFDDEVYLLDIQGNITNAALLTFHLRRRPFIESAGENTSQWIWRVTRWQWEDPSEASWVPFKELPYYAIDRKRIKPETYKTLNITYARHLGGIQALFKPGPNQSLVADLGTLVIPKPLPGIVAVNPDGSPIPRVRIKPAPTASQPDSDPKSKTDGAKP